jgi:hypothetical protein
MILAAFLAGFALGGLALGSIVHAGLRKRHAADVDRIRQQFDCAVKRGEIKILIEPFR